MSDKRGVQTLDRSLKVMEYLASVEKRGAAVQEIARSCGFARPVVYRILNTLGEGGYVQRDASDRFRLGLSLLHLAAACLAGHDLATASLPELQALRDATEGTVRLFVRHGADRICIQRVYGPGLSRPINIGDVLPLQRGASGRVILAFDDTCPETERQNIAPGWLEEVRSNGWALALNERDSGMGVIAAPVFRGQAFLGAIALALPLPRMENGQYHKYLPTLLEHTRRLSEQSILL